MRIAKRSLGAWLPATLLLAGCAGDGSGLDENGRPAGDASEPLTADFASIQQHVFTPLCTGCHAGASAPLGLRLTADASYAALVNAPSVEVPSLRRVTPGNAASSYLVQKISGTAAVGGRMPLGGPALSADMIAAIQQWIANGAQRSAAASVDAPAKLSAAFPMEGSTLMVVPDADNAVVIDAAVELDTPSLNANTVSLTRSDGTPVALAALELRSLSPTVVAIAPREPWQSDRYRLVIAGSGALVARDLLGQPIDGDADGRPGGDFVLEFDVDTAGVLR